MLRYVSDMNMTMEMNMPRTKKTTRDLELAFREAGFEVADALGDDVRVPLGEDRVLAVRSVSAGHGRPQELRNVIALYESAPGPAVFVAARFTTGALDILKERGANYLDDRHFVFRNADPFVSIHLDRAVREVSKPAARTSLGGRTGIAVQEMLLDDREWWRVTELALKAGVAAGTAQVALTRLQEAGLAEAQGAGPNKRRRLTNRGALLERWAADAARERETLVSTYVQAQGPVELASRVSERLREAGIEHAVTGACAALLVAPHVPDVRRCEVWVDAGIGDRALLRALGIDRVDKGGNVTVLRARTDSPLFASGPSGGVNVVNPVRLYADLLQDPRRGEEQAGFLRETVLKI